MALLMTGRVSELGRKTPQPGDTVVRLWFVVGGEGDVAYRWLRHLLAPLLSLPQDRRFAHALLHRHWVRRGMWLQELAVM
jgi:hypothetical protein